MKYNDLIVLIPCHSLEDFPTDLGEEAAASLLNAFTILWHPSLIASTGAYPRWERSDDTLTVQPDRLVVVPTPCKEWVPSTWVERARREGCIVINDEHDREKMLHQALEPLQLEHAVDSELVADFLALGTVALQTELLTRHMRNFSHLDEAHMQRELVAASQAAVAHDIETARRHLQHCFELLLECRERFYPVNCFLIDLCLLNPEFAKEGLADILDSEIPTSVLATGKDWQAIVDRQPEWQARITAALDKGALELLGGEREELPTPLMAVDSTHYQLQQGAELFERLFGRRPRIWGRRRYGLGNHLPQLLDKHGFTGALHFVMDDGIYPDDEQTKLRWEGADGTSVDAFSRIPLAVDSASGFLRFSLRMSESMDYDHTAAVVLARWPKMKTPWLADLRRGAKYAPVLGKFASFGEFFEASDSPGRMSNGRSSSYFSLYLVQSVAKEEANPISRWIDYWSRRRRFEAVDWGAQLATLLGRGVGQLARQNELEAAVEAAHPEATSEVQSAADAALTAAEAETQSKLQKLLAARGEAGAGVLLVNPLSFSRKVLVNWPSGAPGTGAGVLGRQVAAEQSQGLVELPPCGFVWVGSQPRAEPTTPGKVPLAEGLKLRNELFEVELSEVTGGIARISTYRRSPNRVSQQIAYRFPHERTVVTDDEDGEGVFKTYYSLMEMREARILSAGPLVGAIETVGELIDGQNRQPVASFRQVTRVVRGRPYVDVEIELDLKKKPTGDPWSNYVGCRFAWKHTTAALTGSLQQGAHPVGTQRIEAPLYVEIADDEFRTTLLAPGLPYHRKTGERMLDTLLICEGEQRRRFQFSVAIDVPYPMQAALDCFCDPLVIPTAESPPPTGKQGWLFFVGAANVQLTRILPLPQADGRAGYVVRLLETEGRSRKFGLRCFRTPTAARQVDFQGKSIHTLKVEEDQVWVGIAPYEICDVELIYGENSPPE